MNTDTPSIPPQIFTITCNRGGSLALSAKELDTFIQISLEEAIDIMVMSQEGSESEPNHPRIGAHAVALSRIREALAAHNAIAKKQ